MSEQQAQLQINLPVDELAAFCQRWQIEGLAVFGSALREDFGPESDIDLLVTYAPDKDWSLASYLQMYDEIEAILGRKVDLVNRAALERSRNYLRRRNILESARPVYAA